VIPSAFPEAFRTWEAKESSKYAAHVPRNEWRSTCGQKNSGRRKERKRKQVSEREREKEFSPEKCFSDVL